MTDQQREHLSAFLDGEIDETLLRPTISALESSPALERTWERFHLIGQAMRGEAVHSEYRAIAARVRSQIAAEPSPPRRAHERSDRVPRLSPYVGAALAASAALLAVFAVPQLLNTEPELPVSVASTPVAAPPVPAPTRQFEIDRSGQRWHLDKPALQGKLDRFLVNHQAYSPSSRIKGFLPYATVVGYEVGR